MTTSRSMYVPLIAAVAFLAVCTSGVNADVKVLTSANFEHDTQMSTGATTGDWFVSFTAPWCGHCKDLKPTWEELADKLEGEVNIANVDATVHRDLSTRFGVKGFPTLLFFRRGVSYKYKGQRTVEALEKFALGGYSNVEGEEVKAPQSMFEFYTDVFKKTLMVADPTVLVLSILGGALIGGIAAYFILFRGPNTGVPRAASNVAAPKSAAPASTEEDDDEEEEEEGEEEEEKKKSK